MAALNQDFVTFIGDNVSPIFTVQTVAGAAVNISGCQAITWTVQEQDSSTVLLTKTKLAGQITFVTTGADGQFQVAILAADTTALGNGFYIHKASIQDANGNVTTTTVGRMQIGIAPTWTYDADRISSYPLYQVRRLIGDVLYGEQQMQDEEINWFLAQYSNIWTAASACAASLAAQFSRMVDTVQGDLRTLYSQRAKNYSMMAGRLEQQGKARGTAYAFAGGISQSDKAARAQDTDRVPPNFVIGMGDDLLPESPVGVQTPSAPAPNTPGTP